MSAEDAMQFGDVLPTPYVHAYPTDASRAGYNGSVSPGGNPVQYEAFTVDGKPILPTQIVEFLLCDANDRPVPNTGGILKIKHYRSDYVECATLGNDGKYHELKLNPAFLTQPGWQGQFMDSRDAAKVQRIKFIEASPEQQLKFINKEAADLNGNGPADTSVHVTRHMDFSPIPPRPEYDGAAAAGPAHPSYRATSASAERHMELLEQQAKLMERQTRIAEMTYDKERTQHYLSSQQSAEIRAKIANAVAHRNRTTIDALVADVLSTLETKEERKYSPKSDPLRVQEQQMLALAEANLENILGSLSRGVAVDEKTVFDAYVLLSCTYRHHVRNSNNVLANMWAAHTRPNDAAVAAVTDQSMLLPGAVKPKAIAGKNINESA